MIAMQYRIILPADYNMVNIQTRIKEKAHLLDGYPGLVFKAYLYSIKDSPDYFSTVNSYAPFYLWKDTSAMASFLRSPGFAALSEQFGRPSVKSWLLEGEIKMPEQQAYACIESTSTDTADLIGFDCSNWSSLKLNWLNQASTQPSEQKQYYQIGYLARGQ
ncbi:MULTISPECIES: DUF4865 family protein [unclassified Agarivorans]|uniref:DUF4865 family protein n=2 Tax=Agarivorans TaxID=261825 RepID=UPI003D7E033B